MTALYKLSTNEFTDRIVVCKSTAMMQRAMWRYIRSKRIEGMALKDIVFSWSLIRSSMTINDNYLREFTLTSTDVKEVEANAVSTEHLN